MEFVLGTSCSMELVSGLPVSSTDCSMRAHIRLLSGFTLKNFLQMNLISCSIIMT